MAVFAFGVGQASCGGETADFRLKHFPDRKNGFRELILAEEGKEVGLIFIRVEALK